MQHRRQRQRVCIACSTPASPSATVPAPRTGRSGKGSRRCARSMISSLQRSSAATTVLLVRARPVALGHAATQHAVPGRADGPDQGQRAHRRIPDRHAQGQRGASPWPTIAVRRRSRCGWPRIADSMSRASSILVNSGVDSQAPSEAPQPRGSTRRLATPRAASASARRASSPRSPSAAEANHAGWPVRSQASRSRGSHDASSRTFG